MNRNFSKGEAIRFGWEKAKQSFLAFLPILLVTVCIQYFPGIIASSLPKGQSTTGIVSFLLGLVSALVGMLIALGSMKIVLNVIDGKAVQFSALFSQAHLFFKYLLGTILYTLIIAGGFLLLIVPGVIWSIKFQYYGYLIVDEGLGPIDALKKSSQLTQGVKWDLLVFGFLLGLINLAGILALVVGLFITIPTTMIATAYVYRKLKKSIPLEGGV